MALPSMFTLPNIFSITPHSSWLLLNTELIIFHEPSFPIILCTLLSHFTQFRTLLPHFTRFRTLLPQTTTFSGASCRPACSAAGKKRCQLFLDVCPLQICRKSEFYVNKSRNLRGRGSLAMWFSFPKLWLAKYSSYPKSSSGDWKICLRTN